MNLHTLDTAVAEARRFIERAEVLQGTILGTKASKYPHAMNPKEHGAVRRSSMDLTRALAELRRPG